VECGRWNYRNPVPVAALLVPVGTSLLTVRRSIEPRAGWLALPGGFIECGETWQQAAVRELREETGVRIPVSTVRAFGALSGVDDDTVVVFGVVPPLQRLTRAVARAEVREIVMIDRPQRMAFDVSTRAVRAFFSGRSTV